MQYRYLLLALLIFSTCSTNHHSSLHDTTQSLEPTVIAFGSCSRQKEDDQLWDEIRDENANTFILLGDNIYGNTSEIADLAQQYAIQKSRSSYQQLRNSTHIIGTWDDHDYGVNDGGRFFHNKDSSKLLMTNFLDMPDTDPIHSHSGVYNRYVIEDQGKVVKVLLLDTRYFRDTLQADPSGVNRYLPNKNGDILGEEQWEWLASELKNSTADVHIIGSSIQVIAEEHKYEKWANFPKARKRLFSLLQETQPANTIIISGDRHIAELSALKLDQSEYLLYDFTASGLTHTWSTPSEETNRHRIGDLIIERNYGIITLDWQQKKITFEAKGKNRVIFLSHENPLI